MKKRIVTEVFLLAAGVDRQELLDLLPGAEQWQPYLEQSPVKVQALADEPLRVFAQFLPASLWEALGASLRGSSSLLLYLLLAALLAFLVRDAKDHVFLELAAAGGCSVLLWGELADLSEQLCTQTQAWKNFLMGFLPVYSGVLMLGGETAAAGAASGFYLTLLCALAQCIAGFLRPMLRCYLALSMMGCLCADEKLATACKAFGTILRQALGWAGKAFAALLGLQRLATLHTDRMVLQAGQLAAGSVPIIGRALGNAAEMILAAVQLLKSGLGLAALAFLLAEFIPLYFGLLAQLVLLDGCGLFCALTALERCGRLMACLQEAVRCMAAVVALFFGLAVLGTTILWVAGGL